MIKVIQPEGRRYTGLGSLRIIEEEVKPRRKMEESGSSPVPSAQGSQHFSHEPQCHHYLHTQVTQKTNPRAPV